MGTNYYMITKNSKIAHEHFANRLDVTGWEEYVDQEYELSDIPDFHYVIHLNKLSYGWRPLFQIHKAFSTFAQLEQFYKEHEKDLLIKDEYGEEFDWDEYKKEIFDHAERTPHPVKWVYEEDKICGKPGKKYLHTVSCKPEEADLWTPFDHVERHRSEVEAQRRFQAWGAYVGYDPGYINDPDYLIDWVTGEFS